jgi:hypothetical protein
MRLTSDDLIRFFERNRFIGLFVGAQFLEISH